MAITEYSHVNKLPAVKGKNYLFRLTDGQNDKPYEISAQDPQMLEDWVEMLNVVSDRTTCSLCLSVFIVISVYRCTCIVVFGTGYK